MFLPLLQFIEKGQNIDTLVKTSRYWEYLVTGYDFFSLKVTLVSLSCGLMIIMLLRVVIVFVRQIYMAWFSQEMRHQTRSNLFDALVKSDYKLFDEISTGEVVNLASIETIRAAGYFTAIFQVVANFVVLMGMLGVLLWISWSMTLLVMGLMILAGLVSLFFTRHTKKISLKTTLSNKEMAFVLVEKLTTLRLLKLSGFDDRESLKHRQSSEQVKEHLYLLSKLNAKIELIIEPVVVVFGAGLVVISINYYSMSLSQVGVFGLTLLRMLPLVKELLKSFQGYQANYGAVQTVTKALIKAKNHLEDQGGDKIFTGVTKGIRYENISFGYSSKNEPALDNITTWIPGGKLTALVGRSGAGKSTFVDLLPRLRKPDSGSILLDNILIHEYELSSLRQGISFVSQDAEILNDTVRHNLLFFKSNATDKELFKALDQAKAKDFVESLPQGIDTVLGERGAKLSGGERQRLSLARALLKKAPLLILDEPTSAVDSKTEKDIELTINELRNSGKVTIIVIAHRLSTIKSADYIIVLDKGRVVESGNHYNLIREDAWYAAMVKMQSLT